MRGCAGGQGDAVRVALLCENWVWDEVGAEGWEGKERNRERKGKGGTKRGGKKRRTLKSWPCGKETTIKAFQSHNAVLYHVTTSRDLLQAVLARRRPSAPLLPSAVAPHSAAARSSAAVAPPSGRRRRAREAAAPAAGSPGT